MVPFRCVPTVFVPTLAVKTIAVGVVVLVEDHAIQLGVSISRGRLPSPVAMTLTDEVAMPELAASERLATELTRLPCTLSVTLSVSVYFVVRTVTPTLNV